MFNNKQDVLDVVDLLIEETKEVNMRKGKSFDIANSIFKQLPFFACPNIVYDNQVQQDIEKYLYCNEYSVPAYKGSFGEQPRRWIAKSFLFRNAFAKRENNLIKKEQGKSNG